MNNRSIRHFVLGFLAVGTLALTGSAHAGEVGADDADQSAYKDGKTTTWIGGANGGTGFVAWNLISSDATGACGFFIGDSMNLASGSGADINVNGKSFGMFGKGDGHTAAAYRSLASPLAAGQTFSVDIAVNYRNGQKGIDLRNAGDDKVIFNLNIGADDYVVNYAATGTGSAGSDYDSNTIFHLSFTQTDAASGTWTITRRGGMSKSVTGTYSGDPSSLKLYVTGTDDGSENDLMINSLTITVKK